MNKTISALCRKRPVFYSEADFQHSLAWELRCQNEASKIRLEYPIALHGANNSYIDIVTEFRGLNTAIELKYKTRNTSHEITHDNNVYTLKNQSAQDQARYDFVKDIARLEQFIILNPGSKGVAVFLTNDRSYWRKPRRGSTRDSEFRIHEGRNLLNELSWPENAKKGTMGGRESPIKLRNEYLLSWNDYYKFDEDVKNGLFRYLLVNVHG